MDPATFATELGILTLRGFGDMNKRSRDIMIRDQSVGNWTVLRQTLLSGRSLIAAEYGRVIRIQRNLQIGLEARTVNDSPAIPVLGNAYNQYYGKN